MITNKQELKEYLEADKIALSRKRKKPKINDFIWKYEILLRKCEYFSNTHGNTLLKNWYSMKRSFIGTLCGFSVPINTTGKGLCLAHVGPIIINDHAKIGDNCRIHVGVNIGADFRVSDAAPKIGNNVYIGPGAKLFGDIEIADGIAIGANAVVNMSFTEPNISIAGVPARIISKQGTSGVLY